MNFSKIWKFVAYIFNLSFQKNFLFCSKLTNLQFYQVKNFLSLNCMKTIEKCCHFFSQKISLLLKLKLWATKKIYICNTESKVYIIIKNLEKNLAVLKKIIFKISIAFLNNTLFFPFPKSSVPISLIVFMTYLEKKVC